MKKRFVVDIECDSLSPTVLYCVVAYDIDSDISLSFYKDGSSNSDYEIEDFNSFVKNNSEATFIFHNGIAFDIPALNRLIGTTFVEKNVRDTLVMSRLANQERDGGHSLENWGKILSFPKIEFTDFNSGFSMEMLKYCIQDCKLTGRVYFRLLKELKDFSMKSLRLELETQFILQRMSERGFTLNYDKAVDLLIQITTLKDKLANSLILNSPKLPKFNRVLNFNKKYTKDGKLSSLVTKPLGDDAKDLVGPASYIDWIPFNPGSRDQVAWQLMLKGWQPTKFTETGKPQIDEEVLDGIEKQIPSAAELSQYFMLVKRQSQVKSWIDLYNHTTGRVHGRIHHIGARTHRASHVDPNMAQIPATRHAPDGSVLWGLDGTFSADCRSVWVPADGYVQIGVDASAIQLVILAHAMGDEEYAKAVAFGKKADGTDVHTVNRNVLRGIVKEAGLPPEAISRDVAKTFIYAFLLGAGAAKIEQILGLPSGWGFKAKERFLERTPALKRLLEKLRKQVESEGRIKGIDGRYFPCKDAHYALAYILQGYEQAIMKMALVKTYNYFKDNNIDAHILTWVHDEFQIECEPSKVEEVKIRLVKIIEEVGQELQLKCFLTGESRSGANWQQTH